VEEKAVVRLENVTLRVRDRFLLSGTSWKIDKGQHWAILGPNGSGKTSLVKALAGEVPVIRGSILPSLVFQESSRAAYVSFEQHRRMIAREEKRDESRYFSGDLNGMTTVYEMLIECCAEAGCGAADVGRAAAELQIDHLFERGIRVLSTGEMRKVQIARILLQSPEILILDEPFDGLDRSSRKDLARIVDGLMDATRTVILVTHRQGEILPGVSHILAVRDGKVIFQGRREEVLIPSRMRRLYNSSHAAFLTLPAKEKSKETGAEESEDILIRMKNVTVKYDGTAALDNVSWTMNSGENWVISGPNGCGKTTLLNLISGDNPQAYANEIYLFGKRRGTGESIWDIKKQTGMVSSELQIHYRKPVSAREVVLSGFFDSVGLYRNATLPQRKTAEQWMEVFGIADKSDRIFNHLSYGEQRMVLLARSMVKVPRLLILDEPCQGLDRTNRQRILDAVDVAGRQDGTHIIYVTHYTEEIPVCMTHMLEFEKAPSGRYEARWRLI
jgi:molybdate transport system ATP-binding protein